MPIRLRHALTFSIFACGMLVAGTSAGAAPLKPVAGSLDTGYGNHGAALLPLGPAWKNVRQLEIGDGRAYAIAYAGRDVSVALVTQSGGYDPTWGTSGLATISNAHPVASIRVALVPGGGLLIGETLTAAPEVTSTAIARLTPAGQLDGGFGGIRALDLPQLNAVLVTNGHSVLVGGTQATTGSALVRALDDATGEPDLSFGTSGDIVLDAPTKGTVQVLAEGAAGSLLVAYGDESPVFDSHPTGLQRSGVARLAASGARDASYGFPPAKAPRFGTGIAVTAMLVRAGLPTVLEYTSNYVMVNSMIGWRWGGVMQLTDAGLAVSSAGDSNFYGAFEGFHVDADGTAFAVGTDIVDGVGPSPLVAKLTSAGNVDTNWSRKGAASPPVGTGFAMTKGDRSLIASTGHSLRRVRTNGRIDRVTPKFHLDRRHCTKIACVPLPDGRLQLAWSAVDGSGTKYIQVSPPHRTTSLLPITRATSWVIPDNKNPGGQFSDYDCAYVRAIDSIGSGSEWYSPCDPSSEWSLHPLKFGAGWSSMRQLGATNHNVMVPTSSGGRPHIRLAMSGGFAHYPALLAVTTCPSCGALEVTQKGARTYRISLRSKTTTYRYPIEININRSTLPMYITPVGPGRVQIDDFALSTRYDGLSVYCDDPFLYDSGNSAGTCAGPSGDYNDSP